MMAACRGLAGLCGVVVEGGHPGLQNAEQRAERQRSDRQWAQRFRSEPLTAVFADWYQQPVFASLNDDQRRGWWCCAATIMAQPLPPCWRRLLSPSSLIYVLTLAPAHLRFIIYVVNVTANSAPSAAELAADCHVIPRAGHNAHRENPAGVIASLAQILRF